MDRATPDTLALEASALAVAGRLRSAGHKAWWVGGCVRDKLLGRPLHDIDIATDATPEAILALFPQVRLVGAAFGVCLVQHDGNTHEVATLRADGEYADLRRPSSVRWGTLAEDAARRDFTINALYLDPTTGQVTDLVGGEADLRARVLRCVGDPAARLAEDALRLLRAVRLAARLRFTIEPRTWAAIIAAAPTITAISAERVRAELTQMLVDPTASTALRLLDESGLLAHLLPEVAALKGVEQDPRHHPEGDVWTHTLLCMDNLRRRDAVTAWAMLLHDTGKPATQSRDGARIQFLRHELAGSRLADDICARLRFSNHDAAAIADIVARHMQPFGAREWRRSTLRRFLASANLEELLAVHESDLRSASGEMDSWEFLRDGLEELKRSGDPALPAPWLTGDDLARLGLPPGRGFKVILKEAQRRQLDGELAGREEALEWAAREVGQWREENGGKKSAPMR